MIRDIRKTALDFGREQSVTRLEYTSGYDGQSDWALLGGDLSSTMWIVFIHGHGSTADQIYTWPELRDTWLPAIKKQGAGIVSVYLRGNAWMSPAAACDLHDVLAYLREHYPVRTFVFLSGSMGGTSNLIYAALHPEDVAAVVALGAAVDLTKYYTWCREQPGPAVLTEIADAISRSYGGEPQEIPHIYNHHSALIHSDKLTMPVFFVHGQADAIMPFDQARLLRDKMSDVDSFRFQAIADGDHDSPLPYAAEGLEWVLRSLT